jgi:hypothetical protein
MSLADNRDDRTPCDRTDLEVTGTVRTLRKIVKVATGSWLLAVLLTVTAQVFDLGGIGVVANVSLTVAVGFSVIGALILGRYLFGDLKPVRA